MSNVTFQSVVDLNEDETLLIDHKYLTFWVDNQLLGIPIADVVQIIGVQEISSVPEFPSYAKGIINVRGTIIPVIDIRLRLNKPEVEYTNRTCTVVTNIGGSFVGFIVDAVDEVTDIDESQIVPPPRFSENVVNSFLTGIGKLNEKVVLLINSKKILSDDEVEEILSAKE